MAERLKRVFFQDPTVRTLAECAGGKLLAVWHNIAWFVVVVDEKVTNPIQVGEPPTKETADRILRCSTMQYASGNITLYTSAPLDEPFLYLAYLDRVSMLHHRLLIGKREKVTINAICHATRVPLYNLLNSASVLCTLGSQTSPSESSGYSIDVIRATKKAAAKAKQYTIQIVEQVADCVELYRAENDQLTMQLEYIPIDTILDDLKSAPDLGIVNVVGSHAGSVVGSHAGSVVGSHAGSVVGSHVGSHVDSSEQVVRVDRKYILQAIRSVIRCMIERQSTQVTVSCSSDPPSIMINFNGIPYTSLNISSAQIPRELCIDCKDHLTELRLFIAICKVLDIEYTIAEQSVSITFPSTSLAGVTAQASAATQASWPATTSDQKDSQLPSQTAKQVVMIVEDDTDNRELLTAVLESISCVVIACKTAAEAIRVDCKSSGISLVLLDINLPDIDGVTLSQVIRKKHSVRIVAVTAGYLDSTDKKHFDAVLYKPISLADIKKITSLQ